MRWLFVLAAIIGAQCLAARVAAQTIINPEATAVVRHNMQPHHGGMTVWKIFGERLEYQSNDGDPALVFEGEALWGGDRNKLWLKTEGEYDFNAAAFDQAELQVLYSRAVRAFWDVQTGVRRDFAKGVNRTWGVFGVKGLAPYLFETDAAIFVSGHGEATARIEAEYELLFTQRLILQPRVELNLSAQDIPELEIGSGLTSAELGARLRYEFSRQFAPYVGFEWRSAGSSTARLQRVNGGDPRAFSVLAGIRFWF